MLSGYHLDFGGEDAQALTGYVSAPVAQYSASLGYGWTDVRGVRAVDRGVGTPLTQDLHAEKDRTFRLDVDNGTYLVTPTLGDPTMVRDRIDLYLNGKQVASNLEIAAGRPYRPTYRVEVTDNKLSLRLIDRGGTTVRWAISALDVVSTSSAAPVVALSPDQFIQEGSTAALKGFAGGQANLTYRWDFGDGKTATGTLASSHRYTDDGTYVVRLTATDAQGRKGSAVSTVIVKNGVPQAKITGAPLSAAKEGASITLGSTVSDPSPTDAAAGFQAAWSITKNGKAFASSTGKLGKFTFVPDDQGTYVATLIVTDKDGGKSAAARATIQVLDVPLRANILGPYEGTTAKPIDFAAIARDISSVDAAAGYTFSWNFGDGRTASGATPSHRYAAAGNFNVTLKVRDKDGVTTTATTTAKISTAAAPALNDFQLLSSNLLSNTVYEKTQWKEMAASGAWGINAQWEQGASSTWRIEQQRYGEGLIIDGLLHDDTVAIAAGLKAFDWGFKQQAADGSFPGTADPFHSTSFFVSSVARICLLLQQSPYSEVYAAKVAAYTSRLDKAANWMTRADVWSRGIANNAPYTHRHYLVANALGMTSRLVGGNDRLSALARSQIRAGVLQQLSNGVNPEAGGYDSSYQAVGVTYAQLWTTYFPQDSTSSSVRAMLGKALEWEYSRVESNGNVLTNGNSRTGIETGPSGTTKVVDWRSVVTAFSRTFQTTRDTRWQAAAQSVAQHNLKNY